MSVQIIEIFVKLRALLLTHNYLLLKMDEIERRVGRQDDKIQMIFDCLKEFVKEKTETRSPIGFKQENRK